jgi:hypothetical protein
MAQPQLIDRYLIALQRSLGQTPDASDILAEVEDHLRETATTDWTPLVPRRAPSRPSDPPSWSPEPSPTPDARKD